MNYDALITGISDAHRLERMRVFYNHYPQISSVISSSAMRICPSLLPGNKLPISATAVRKSPSISNCPVITPSAARGNQRRPFRAAGCFANRKAGGFTAGSRWSSAATPPDTRSKYPHPGRGVLAVDQHEP